MCVDSGVCVPFRLTAHTTKAVFILQYFTDHTPGVVGWKREGFHILHLKVVEYEPSDKSLKTQQLGHSAGFKRRIRLLISVNVKRGDR